MLRSQGHIPTVEFTPFREQGKQPRFLSLYCSLGPLKKGFEAGCWHIIGLDGCHLKRICTGQLSIAIAVDISNGLVPIPWAIVEREAKGKGSGSLSF